MEEMNNTTLDIIQESTPQTNKVIESYQKWFNIFPEIPSFLAIALSVIFLGWGIIAPSIFTVELETVTYYGLLKQESFFSAMLLWWLIGAIVTALTYCITKLSLCYPILHIYYLKSINEKSNNTKQ